MFLSKKRGTARKVGAKNRELSAYPHFPPEWSDPGGWFFLLTRERHPLTLRPQKKRLRKKAAGKARES